jgi:hypothetical protein
MDDDERLRYKGDKGFARGVLEVGAVEITERFAHTVIGRREVEPTRIGNANWFSRRDIEEWLRSRKQPGHYNVPKSPAAPNGSAAKPHKKQLSDDAIADIRRDYAEGKWKIGDLAYIHGVSRHVISTIVNSDRPAAVGE